MVLKCRFEQNEETHNYVGTWYILFLMTFLNLNLEIHYITVVIIFRITNGE